MATPQSTTSYDAAAPKEDLEQITFRFCSECSNMLYPKEDEDAHKLQYTCRTCQYTEDATSSCVFRNILNNSSGETAGVTQDVGSDPTVSDHYQHSACLGICLACGDVIRCNSCGDTGSEFDIVEDTKADDEAPVDFFAQLGSHFSMVPYDDYDEYDEMESEASATETESTNHDCFSTPSNSSDDERE